MIGHQHSSVKMQGSREFLENCLLFSKIGPLVSCIPKKQSEFGYVCRALKINPIRSSLKPQNAVLKH
jgi:hypothetical protein